jgi:putative membrane protein
MEPFSPSRRRPHVLFWTLIGAAGFSLSLPAAPAAWRLRQLSAHAAVRGMVVEPLATETLRPNERAFLERALESARDQVRLAALGTGQATSSEVRSLAQQIGIDQRGLVDSLDALIRRKGVITQAPAEKESDDGFQGLAEKTWADFDGEFVRVMAERHGELFALVEHAASEARDPDVRDLAAAQLPTLRGHRNTLVELKRTFD